MHSNDNKLVYAPTCTFGLNLPKLYQKDPNLKFDPSFPSAAFEDIDFSIKLQKANIPIDFQPLAVMQHDYNTNWLGFARQFLKYGQSEGLFLERHPDYSHLMSMYQPVSSVAEVIHPFADITL
jgi:hypothetical protein